MDRIIEIKVNGSYLSKDSNVAGVQHEANAKVLRIEFDEGWDGYAKTATFWNALGEMPTKRVLTADLLEDLAANTRIYLCPIPGEAMTEDGEMKFVIDGYNGPMFVGNRPCLTASFKIEGTDSYTLCLKDYLLPEEHAEMVGKRLVMGGETYTIVAAGYKGDSEHTILTMDRTFTHPEEGARLFQPGGKRQRSEECWLKVKEGEIDLEAGESMDPTPTQAEQLQVQIDTVIEDMSDYAGRAETAAAKAEVSADNAKISETNAAKSAQDALTSENFANGFMMDAQFAAEGAAASEKTALECAQKAEASEANAAKSEVAAAESAMHAANSENFADGYMQDAKLAAEEAAMSAEAAAAYENAAVESGVARDQAATHAANAAKSAKEAAASAEKAAGIAGGDFATRAELAAVADAAQSVLNVTLTSTDDGADADKSHAEIMDAYLDGKRVFLDYPALNVYGVPLVYANSLNAIFSMAFCRQGSYIVFSAIINGDGVMHVEYPEFPLADQVGQYLDSLADQMEQGMDSLADSMNAHVGNTNNPHGVTAAQVGAVKKAGDKMTGDLEIEKAIPTTTLKVSGSEAHTALRKNATASVDLGTQIVDAVGESDYTRLLLAHKDNVFSVERVEGGGLKGSFAVYHEGNKPTPADIGALSDAGDIMTGQLRFQPANTTAQGRVYKNVSSSGVDYGTYMVDTTEDNSVYAGFRVIAREQKLRAFFRPEGATADTHVDVYHTGNKPTAADIQAGTLATGVKASIGTDYTTMRLRNIMAQTADVTAGTTGLSNGNIVLVYE